MRQKSFKIDLLKIGLVVKFHENPFWSIFSCLPYLELFFEDLSSGGTPSPENWTYFVRELNPEELELVEKKDKSYFKKFKWSSNPDVDETEMQLSTSTSKYVSSYCNRRTYLRYK